MLVNESKSVVGVDIRKEDIEKLKNIGYDVYHGDVETMNLNRKFDVIVAGEVIEHLSNQGIFLENMKRHLKKNGVLILTTPNAFSIRFLIKQQYWLEHVCWHTFDTIKALAKKHGFSIVELYYCWLGKPKRLTKLIGKFFPRLMTDNILAVLKWAPHLKNNS